MMGMFRLLGLLVLARSGGDIIVDRMGGEAPDSRGHLAALRLDVRLQLVAVLVVVDVARDDEGQSLAEVTLWLVGGLGDADFLQQAAVALQVVRVAEPAYKLRRLLRTDAVDVGKHFLWLCRLFSIERMMLEADLSPKPSICASSRMWLRRV